MFELLILALTFIVLLIATIQDWKTREIPDYLSYFFIITAISFRALQAVDNFNLMTVIWILVAAGVFIPFSYLMYRAGQWGGGDVKLMAGLSIALSSFSTDLTFPYFINFFINVMVVGAIYGIIMTLYLGLKNISKLKSKIGKVDIILVMAVAIAVIAIIYYINFNPAIMFLLILLVVALGLLKYLKLIEKYCMISYVPIKNLTEGDWLVKEIRSGKTIVRPRAIGLIDEDLTKLNQLYKHGKIKEALIKIGIPFIPAFFFAFLVTSLVGNVIFVLLSMAL